VSVFIFLHIATMFAAVALSLGPLVLLIAAVRRRDVPAIRGLLTAQRPMVRWIPRSSGSGSCWAWSRSSPTATTRSGRGS
jgi:hypothetical protein